MAYKTIEIRKDGPVDWVTLNRPDRLNTIDPELIADLNAALDRAEDDPAARQRTGTARGQGREDDRHRRLHRLGALHQLREEVLALLPQLAHPADSGREPVLDRGDEVGARGDKLHGCPLYTSPSPRDRTRPRMPASA